MPVASDRDLLGMQLLPHPATPRGPVNAFDVMAARPGRGTLRLTYRLDADLRQLRLPAAVPPERANDLWRHTCFEAFITTPGSTTYCELNFSPSGQWAAYTFRSPRSGMQAPDLTTAPAMMWRRTDGQLELSVEVSLDGLLPDPDKAPLRLALSAVIEEQSGTISYWALRHPEKEADFHHPGSFVLELAIHERGTPRS